MLPDWDDIRAAEILATCRRAMPEHGRLLVVDAILPERVHDAPAAIRMDLHMLLLFGSAERTANQLRHLLKESGFDVRSIFMTIAPAGLGVVKAIPA